ncbi:hypothetical protein NLJ89_g3597 [Agrocybe chaxingu]|uniref:DNA polymerase alpha subunit B n=1 Tax=Agrocybe chaxingu TaxID=84603 RepID=A0A9W8K4I6_9AGAR|nr:hypothetical protein NLJ89_g3597 [Agrocybe chaxingu]
MSDRGLNNNGVSIAVTCAGSRPYPTLIEEHPLHLKLVKFDMDYLWKTSSETQANSESHNFDTLVNPFSRNLSLPYLTSVNDVVGRFVKFQLVKCRKQLRICEREEANYANEVIGNFSDCLQPAACLGGELKFDAVLGNVVSTTMERFYRLGTTRPQFKGISAYHDSDHQQGQQDFMHVAPPYEDHPHFEVNLESSEEEVFPDMESFASSDGAATSPHESSIHPSIFCIDSEDELEGRDHKSSCIAPDEDFLGQHLSADPPVGEDDETGRILSSETFSMREFLDGIPFADMDSDCVFSSDPATLGFNDHWSHGTSSSQEEYNLTSMRTNSVQHGVVLDSAEPHKSQETPDSSTERHREPATTISKNCERQFLAGLHSAPAALYTAYSDCWHIDDDDFLDSCFNSEDCGIVSIHSDSWGHGVMGFGSELVNGSSERGGSQMQEKLDAQERLLLDKYGKLPQHKNILMKMQKTTYEQERKYFDSGDYALSKAGVAPQTAVGTAIPNPENIPHASSPGNGHGPAHQSLSISPTNSTSPVNKESSLAHDENTKPPVDETDSTEAAAIETAPAAETIIVEHPSRRIQKLQCNAVVLLPAFHVGLNRDCVGVMLDEKLVAQCVSICNMYVLEPESLLWKLQALNYNASTTHSEITPITMDTLSAVKTRIQQDLAKEISRKAQPKPRAFATAIVDRSKLSKPMAQRYNPAAPSAQVKQESVRETNSAIRSNNIVTTNVSFSGPSTDSEVKKKRAYRYMYEKISERSESLDQLIDDFAELIRAQYEEVSDFSDPSASTDEEVYIVGRITHDSETASGAKLAEGSITIESSRMLSSGARVPLVLDPAIKIKGGTKGVGGVGLYPGAIVALKGKNGSGGYFLATEFLTGLEIPHLKPSPAAQGIINPKPDPATSQNTATVLVACGPFTSDLDIGYKPWRALLQQIKTQKPDVVLLLGPFVDIAHPKIKSGDLDVAPSNLFRAHFVDPLKGFLTASPGSIVLLVPSVRDIASNHAAFPQPELGADVFGSNPRVHLLPNPARFTINDISFGVTSVDTLFHLRKEEYFKRGVEVESLPGHPDDLPTDSMANLCRHLLLQRSFYPIFPVPQELSSEVNLDVTHFDSVRMVDDGELDYAPDVLLLPSRLKQFSKVIHSTTTLNPSFLTKGTYGTLTIAPRSSGPPKERVKAEVTKIDYATTTTLAPATVTSA